MFSLTIRILSTLTVTLIAFGVRDMRALFRRALLTLCVSFMYSGIMTAIYLLFKPPNMLIVNDIVYFEFDPIVLLAVTAVIYLLIYLFELLFRERMRSTVVRLVFKIDDAEYRVFGKVDTGCSLVEPFSGSAVIIVDNSILSIPDDREARVIPYTALGHISVLRAVKASSVTIDGRDIDKEIYIAPSQIRGGAFKALINPDIIR